MAIDNVPRLNGNQWYWCYKANFNIYFNPDFGIFRDYTPNSLGVITWRY